MTSGIPWQIEARETAREAARRSGVSVVEWINSVIDDSGRPPGRDEAERRLPTSRPRSLRDDDYGGGAAEALAGTSGRLDEVGRQLDQVSRRNAQTAYPRSPAREAGDLADLIARIDPLDTLRDDLAEIGLMLKEAMPRQAIESVENEARSLSARLKLAPQTERTDAAFASVERSLADIRDALRALTPAENLAGIEETVRDLSHRIDHLGSGSPDTGTLQQVEDAIAGLRDVAAQVASNGALTRLSDEIAALAARIDQIARPNDIADLLATLEQRIASIADALDQRTQLAPPLPQDLDAVVRELADKLEQIRFARSDPAGVRPIEDRFAKLDSSNHRLDQIESIERQLSDLVASVERRQIEPSRTERRPIDPSLPPDQPIEPGAWRARDGNSPGQRIAAEAAPGSAKPPGIVDPGGKSNFIAAARRAAQAAGTEAARSEKRAPAAATPSIEARAAPRWGRRVRAVLVAISVVIIVLGSLRLAASLLNGPSEPDRTYPAETRTLPENGSAVLPWTPAGNDPASSAAPPTPGRRSLLDSAGGASALVPAALAAEPIQPAAAEPIQPAATGPIQSHITVVPVPDVTGSLDKPLASMPARPAAKPAPTAASRPALDKLPATFSSTLRAAAAKGDPGAEYEIAERYADGRGAPQNLAEAADWFARAAKQGLVLAQFRLGGFYEKGLGVKKDLEAARRLYTSAAAAGNAKAMHNLAVLYAEGIDGKADYATAAKWFQRAASYGLADSQFNLGILYARGAGVETNLAEAYKWFALAASDGDKEAASKRDEVGGRLDPSLLAAAKIELESWSALDQPEAATQASVPPDGWDPVILTPPPNPKPRAGTVKAETSPAAR
jgi:hypothetical protein